MAACIVCVITVLDVKLRERFCKMFSESFFCLFEQYKGLWNSQKTFPQPDAQHSTKVVSSLEDESLCRIKLSNIKGQSGPKGHKTEVGKKYFKNVRIGIRRRGLNTEDLGRHGRSWQRVACGRIARRCGRLRRGRTCPRCAARNLWRT